MKHRQATSILKHLSRHPGDHWREAREAAKQLRGALINAGV